MYVLVPLQLLERLDHAHGLVKGFGGVLVYLMWIECGQSVLCPLLDRFAFRHASTLRHLSAFHTFAARIGLGGGGIVF